MNTVVGFIGPKYLYDGKQILHLEDHFVGSVTHTEVIMRVLFALLALSGLGGIAFGVLTIISGRQAGVPFSYENYGGPGSIIGGLLLVAVSLYLLLSWGRKESSSGAAHHV
jgi:hypothetical protein